LLKFIDEISVFGYDSININFGCPSGTVVKKSRGSGFLRDPDAVDDFLNNVFKGTDIDISIKTRIGYYDASEFERILEVSLIA
jgi:tRNA-dihydrouridine synthase